MKNANSYSDWKLGAAELDRKRGSQEWRLKDEDPNYNAVRVRSRYDRLSSLHDAGDVRGMVFLLNEGIHGNQDGMGRAALYKRSLLGTKKLIEDYVGLVCECLRTIAEAGSDEIAFDEKLDFFRRANHCFGRSALALSGAAGLIYFHQGVVHSLIENDVLPDVISGSSAGAWMCAQLGTLTDAELKNHFVEQRYYSPEYDTHRLSGAHLRDFLGKEIGVRSNYKDSIVDHFVSPDITFQEAFEKTGRYINISVAPSERHQSARLLNVITSPSVTISSAAKASGSVPGLFAPVQLYAKNKSGRKVKYLPGQLWVDGSVSEDLPFKKIARLYGANHFIVSMANPVAIPFLSAEPPQSEFSIASSVRSMVSHAGKEAIKIFQNTLAPLGGDSVNTFMSLLQEVINQQYHGDINISLGLKHLGVKKFFFSYKSEEEVENLILAGQQASWSKMAQIKTSGAISRTLRDALNTIEVESLAEKHGHRRKHIVI